jgi:hypothetical protein
MEQFLEKKLKPFQKKLSSFEKGEKVSRRENGTVRK